MGGGGWGGGGGVLFQGIQFAISLILSFVWISTFVMTGHPGLGWATQPPALGGPYGDQGFWFFKSTDERSKFQNRMFISFPQFLHCSRDEVYFPKLSCLIAAHDGTLHSKWAPHNGCYASHSWRHKATCEVPAALWCHVVRGCLGDVSNEDLAIIENNQFTNLIE